MSTYHVTCNVLTDMEGMEARLLREKNRRMEFFFFFFNKKSHSERLRTQIYFLVISSLLMDRISIMMVCIE